MANYVDAEDLRAVLPKSASRLDDSFLQARLDEWESLVVMTIGPLTAGNEMAKTIIREGAAADVERTLYLGEYFEEEPPTVEARMRRAMAWLKLLEEKTNISVDNLTSFSFASNITSQPHWDPEADTVEDISDYLPNGEYPWLR